VRSSKTAVHLQQAPRRHDTKSSAINIDRSVKTVVHSNPLRWNNQTQKECRSMCSIQLSGAVRRAVLFPRTARYEVAGDVFGRLVPLSGSEFILFLLKSNWNWNERKKKQKHIAVPLLFSAEQSRDETAVITNVIFLFAFTLRCTFGGSWTGVSENTQFWEYVVGAILLVRSLPSLFYQIHNMLRWQNFSHFNMFSELELAEQM
jgi:hypothetical protein